MWLLGFLLFFAGPGNYFDKRVAPILVKRCLPCHNRELNGGGISFQDRESLLKAGRHGPAVVPGKPEESFLIQVLQHTGDIRMPPGPKLPAKEIKALTDWIRRGAPWGATPQAGGKKK